MIPFLAAIPGLILWGCLALVVATIVMSFLLTQQVFKVRSQIGRLAANLRSRDGLDRTERHHGLPLQKLEELRARCNELDTTPREWWEHIDQSTECYTSPNELDGWFLTERARNILPYEVTVGGHFHGALFSSFPGLLTGSGLALTFVAILLALHGVQYNEANASNPVTGIGGLINGLSGKFLSSIVALILSILFTLYEKRVVRSLRLK